MTTAERIRRILREGAGCRPCPDSLGALAFDSAAAALQKGECVPGYRPRGNPWAEVDSLMKQPLRRLSPATLAKVSALALRAADLRVGGRKY